MTDQTTDTAAAINAAGTPPAASPADWTPGTLPVGVSITADGIAVTMPTTPPAIKGFFEKLVNELEDIPGEVTYELSCAKDKVLAAISYVESHFQSAKTTAETDVASIKTEAADVQAAVEKAI